MSKALSLDLRTRVLAAVADGASHRAAAARFGVSAASLSRWRALERTQGDARPGPLGGDRRSGRVEELRRALAGHGHLFGYGTLQRFFARHRITRKKTAHASEQAAPTS